MLLMNSLPNPGIPNMYSITIDPVITLVVIGPRMVTTGMSALRSACRMTTMRERSPLAQAVRT